MKDRYYRILGNKCIDCGAEFYPPVHKCRRCRSQKLVDAEMPRRGKLLSYTLQKESIAGFEDQEPMMFGLLQLENGVKILSQLVDVPYESLKLGDKFKAVFRKIRMDGASGQIFYGYKFAPVGPSEA